MNETNFKITEEGKLCIKPIPQSFLDSGNLYIYMNPFNFFITKKPINRETSKDLPWTKYLGLISVDKRSKGITIEIEKTILALTKKENGEYSGYLNEKEGSFHLYFQPGKFDICKPFRMEADGELFKYPKFLEEQNGELYYDSNINLPYIISSSKNETTSKKGIKFDVQIFNDMLEKPLEEGEFLYLTAVREHAPSGLYKNYLLPIYRSKDNSRIKTVTHKK